MATKTKRRPPKRRPVQHPKRREEKKRRTRWLPLAAVAVAIVGASIAFAVPRGGDGDRAAPAPAGGLPDTPDYHSLLVGPGDAEQLVLGTHQGLYRSTDGGRTWNFAELSGQDAMNLAQPAAQTVWAAGHDVLAKSTDGGATWDDVRPKGLPGLDVHGFAVDPNNERVLYAAMAGQGLYRSRDGGNSFSLVSRRVGPNVMALARTPDDRILAGDMRAGLLESSDGGNTWKVRAQAALMGIAVNPVTPKRVLATGPGILLSTDGGRTWKQVLELADGAGPVAWAASDPSVAYVVGFDRTLYKTADGGTSWQPVG